MMAAIINMLLGIWEDGMADTTMHNVKKLTQTQVAPPGLRGRDCLTSQAVRHSCVIFCNESKFLDIL